MGEVSTFFTLMTLRTSPLTTLGGPAMNSRTAVPLTGGFIRAFISSSETGAGAAATAGVASFFGEAVVLGVAAALLAACAKAAVAGARQHRTAANVSAKRLIVFLLGYRDPRPGIAIRDPQPAARAGVYASTSRRSSPPAPGWSSGTLPGATCRRPRARSPQPQRRPRGSRRTSAPPDRRPGGRRAPPRRSSDRASSSGTDRTRRRRR